MRMRDVPAAWLGVALLVAAWPVVAETAADDDRALLNPLSSIAADSLEGLAGRPLFSPSRRPPPEAEPEPVFEEPEPVVEAPEPEQEEEVTPPNVRLSGVLRTAEGVVAVLRDIDADITLTVRQDETVGDWMVAEIGDASIRLVHEDQEHSIRLFQPGPRQDDVGMFDEEEEFLRRNDPAAAELRRRRAAGFE